MAQGPHVWSPFEKIQRLLARVQAASRAERIRQEEVGKLAADPKTDIPAYPDALARLIDDIDERR